MVASLPKAVSLAFALVPCLGWTALKWEKPEIQLTAKLGDKLAIAAFPFQNTGATSITITEVQPTCSCTTAELLKPNYAPGESGEIKAIFTFDERVGPQEKFIKVKTDDPTAPNTVLTFRLTIPELISCTPRSLRWTKGAAPAELSTVIVIADPYRISSIEISGPKPEALAFRVVPIELGKKYQLFVRPVAPDTITNGPIALHCLARLEDGSSHPFQVIALVQ